MTPSDDNPALRLAVIIASTRPVRMGKPVGDWVAERARAHGGFDVDVADLAELDLPLMNEPKHPRFGDYQHAHTKAWSDRVAAADAFVFVLPEYNHGFTAPIKNAIDYLNAEWRYKPVGFASYGGVAGGTRAVQGLKPVLVVLKMTPLVEGVVIPFVATHVSDGVFTPTEVMEEGVDAMFDELVRMAEVLRPLRADT
jgi:NAD(P)H-dependent FMN reductase